MYNGYTKEGLISKLSGTDFFASKPNYIIATDEVGWRVRIGDDQWLYLIVRTNDVVCRYPYLKDEFSECLDIMMSLPLSDISEVNVAINSEHQSPKGALVFTQSDGKVRARWPFNPIDEDDAWHSEK